MTIEEIALEFANSLVLYVGAHGPVRGAPPDEVFTIGLGAGKSDSPVKDILVMSESFDHEELAKRQIGDVRRFLAKHVAGVLRDVVKVERERLLDRLDEMSYGEGLDPCCGTTLADAVKTLRDV